MSFTASVDEIVAENRSGLLGAHLTWLRVPLGEAATILNGFPFPSAQFSSEAGTPLLRIRDIRSNQTECFFNGEVQPDFVVSSGDLIVGMDGDFNCALWRGGRAALNQRTCRVTPDERFYRRRFLAYVLPGFLTEVNEHTSAITVKHLSSRTLAQLPLPLPPLPEQDRIVAAIEQQLSRVDAGVAALERVQKELARYRASVLKAACEGRLVPTEASLARAEGRSYEPASELLARILAERRARWEASNAKRAKRYTEPASPDDSALPEVPKGWVWGTVEQLNEGTRPCAYGVLQPGDDVPKGVPFVRVGDIDGGRVAVDQLKRIAPSIAAAYPRTKLRGAEVLLTLVGTIGRTAVAPTLLAGGNVARAVGVLPICEAVSPYWVEVWFRNPARIAELTAASHEVARKTLNLEDVRKARVALPPIAEQHRIVAEVERRLSIADEVAASVASALARAARLRQSILKRAFEGKLVPQDPNDEPASALLARIRAEREAAATNTKRRVKGAAR